MNDSDMTPGQARRAARKAKRKARRAARRRKGRLKTVSTVPVGSLPSLAPSGGPSPVATQPLWNDPRVLLAVAAALILFLRPKKS